MYVSQCCIELPNLCSQDYVLRKFYAFLRLVLSIVGESSMGWKPLV